MPGEEDELFERLLDANSGPCEVSEWSEWSPCSHPCAPADVREQPKQWRIRQVTKRGDVGLACPDLYESRPCDPAPPACAKQDCVMGEWSDWSPCSGDGGSLACGTGVSFSYRPIVTQPSGIGAVPCEPTVRFRQCSKIQCAEGCRVGPWGAWSECSEPCGGGRQARSREVLPPTVFGAEPACNVVELNTHAREERDCNVHACGTDCILAPWRPLGECSKPCGGGTQRWFREVVAHATGDKQPCPPATSPQRQELRPCNTQSCATEEEQKAADETDIEPSPPPEDEPPPDQQAPATVDVPPVQDPAPSTSTPAATTPAARSQPPPIPWTIIGGILGVLALLGLALLTGGSGSPKVPGRFGLMALRRNG